MKFMPKNPRSPQTLPSLKELSELIRNFWNQVWPIDWVLFTKPGILSKAIASANYFVKLGLTLSVIGFSIGMYLIATGTYLSFTKDVPSTGGDFYEGLINADIRNLNPVLELNTDAEKKITALLYQPLYQLEFPDYLNQETDPIITPVLLTESPKWQDIQDNNPENRYKVLRFTLRSNIKWSDNKDITTDDVQYSFERIKDDNGNSQFKNIFSNLEFNKISSTQFDLISKNPNPQLIWAANFTPISAEYYKNQTNSGLLTDAKSLNPEVTSGYFVLPTSVKDPEASDPTKAENKNNPARNTSGTFKSVTLVKNRVQNKEDILIDRYVFWNLDALVDNGGPANSLEKLARGQKLDLFTRNLTDNLGGITSTELKTLLKLEQTIQPTNIYYTAFINIRRSDDGYFINSFLRKFLACSLVNYTPKSSFQPFLETIPNNKKLLPIQLNVTQDPDCPKTQEEVDRIILDVRDRSDRQIYTIDLDEARGLRQIKVYGSQITLNTLTLLENSNPLLGDFRQYLQSLGFTTNDPINDPDRVRANLNSTNKQYNIALLPIQLNNRDLYTTFGLGGRDIIQVTQNNREPIPSYNLEDQLKQFSLSNLADKDARDKIIQFFKSEFAMVNLYRAKSEINYGQRANDFGEFNFRIFTTQQDLYLKLPQWYLKTDRK